MVATVKEYDQIEHEDSIALSQAHRSSRCRAQSLSPSATPTFSPGSQENKHKRKKEKKAPQTSLLFPSSLRLRHDPKDRNVQWIFLGCPGVSPHRHRQPCPRRARVSQSPRFVAFGDCESRKLLSDAIIINLLSKRFEAGISQDG